MAKRERLFSAAFILVGLSKLFGSSVFSLMNATTAPYVMQTLGVDATQAGIAVGIFTITAIVSRLFAGHYTEIVGRRPLFIGGTAFLLFASLLYLLPVNYIGFVLVRLVNGLAFGIAGNLVNTVVVEFIPRSRFGEGMGYFALTSTFSYVLGPFLGLIVMQRLGNGAMLAMAVVFALLSLITAVPVPVAKAEGSLSERHERIGRISLRSLIEFAAVPLALIIFFLNAANGCVNSFVAVFADEIGIGGYSSLYFLFYSLAMLVSRPFAGRMLDKFGDRAVLLPSFVFALLSYAVLAACQNVPMLVISAILQACGQATLFSTVQSIVVRDAEPGRVGAATATFYIFADSGLGLGPMILGGLEPGIGYAGIYAVSAVIVVLCLGYYALISRSKKA